MPIRIGFFVIITWLAAAHFFRSGSYWLVFLCLAAPLLFFYKKHWSLILLQLGAYWASAIWLGALLELVQFRQQAGRPWTTAAVILGSVALLTLLAGLLMNSRCMREHYRFRSSR